MKVASRFLLPLEMLLGLNTLFWGITGGGILGDNVLSLALETIEHDFVWCVTLGSIGFVKTAMAFCEWRFGRIRERGIPAEPIAGGGFIARSVWSARMALYGACVVTNERLSTDDAIYRFVSARCFLAFLMVGAWVAATVVAFTVASIDEIPMVLPSAVMNVGFSFWVFYENLKMKYMLDATIPTSSLLLHR